MMPLQLTVEMKKFALCKIACLTSLKWTTLPKMKKLIMKIRGQLRLKKRVPPSMSNFGPLENRLPRNSRLNIRPLWKRSTSTKISWSRVFAMPKNDMRPLHRDRCRTRTRSSQTFILKRLTWRMRSPVWRLSYKKGKGSSRVNKKVSRL